MFERSSEQPPQDPFADLADNLRQEVKEGATAFIVELKARYINHGFSKWLVNVGALVEPTDRTLGYDEEFSRARSFHKGSLVGMCVVDSSGADSL